MPGLIRMEGPGVAVFRITRYFFSLVVSLCPGMTVLNCTSSTRISPIIFHDNISRSSSHLQEDLPDVFPHQAHQDKLNTAEKQYHDHQRGPAGDGLTGDQMPVQGPDR